MNYLLKFVHSNGSNVWFTVYTQHPNEDTVLRMAENIAKRTSFKFTGDITLL